ncbi:MAG: hypothetical protein RLZ44_1422 [Pseudomonadota bacterium]|jgi:competence protein ComGC
MIRLLLVLAIIGLGLVLVSRGLERSAAPIGETGTEARRAVQEAEQVKALLEQQQQLLQQQTDAVRRE